MNTCLEEGRVKLDASKLNSTGMTYYSIANINSIRYECLFDRSYITKEVYDKLSSIVKKKYELEYKLSEGSVVHETSTGNVYIFDGSEYILIEKPEDNKDDIEPKHHPIKISRCPDCGGRLMLNNVNSKGIVQCEWCDSDIYVW